MKLLSSLILTCISSVAFAQQTALPTVPTSADPQWDFGREWVGENLLTLPEARRPTAYRKKVFKKHLVSIIQISKSEDGTRESYAGSGFFVQEDFPLLHTAAHVVRGLDLQNAKTYLFYWDNLGLRHKMQLTQAQVRFSASGHDHAVIDTTGTPIAKHFAFRRTFLKSKGTPKLSEKLWAAGFKGTSIEGVKRSFFRIPQATFNTARFTVSDARASFCVSRKVSMTKQKTKSWTEVIAKQNILDAVLASIDLDTTLSWLRNREQMGVPSLSESRYVYPDGSTQAFDTALEKVMGQDPDFAGYKGADSFCSQDTQMGPGMSGGPVFNESKEVVGLVSMRLLGNYEGLSITQTLDSNWLPAQTWRFRTAP